MIPLIGLLLSVYLAFKGLEIFQIAYSNKDAPGSAVVLGVAALYHQLGTRAHLRVPVRYLRGVRADIANSTLMRHRPNKAISCPC